MPQLRHPDTSALIAESDDPLSLVLIARELGVDRVLLDGVGAGFDPAAALVAVGELETPTNLDAATTAVAALLESDDPDVDPVTVVLERPPVEIDPTGPGA